MFPALPHHGKAVVGTIVSGHRIRDMMKKERQEGQEGSRDAYADAVSGYRRTDSSPFGISLIIFSRIHLRPRD